MAAPERAAWTPVLLAAFLVSLLVGCSGDGQPERHADADISDAEFRERNMDWRERRLSRLTEPYGWLSLIGLEMLAPSSEWRIGSGPDNDVVVPRGPQRWGVLRVDASGENAVFDAAADGGAVTIDGAVVDSAPLDVDGPTRIEAGGIRMHLVDPGGRLGLRIRDPQSPSRVEFAGLDYYPLDRGWRVDAEFIPHPDGHTIQVANVMGQLIDEPNPGRVRFTQAGKTITLEAVREDDELFFIFADRTSGRETYGLGRFLYSKLPQNGRVILDFNQSYNPPCAFNAYTTCPLPPQDNRIDAAIRAGEKKYGGKPGIEQPLPTAD